MNSLYEYLGSIAPKTVLFVSEPVDFSVIKEISAASQTLKFSMTHAAIEALPRVNSKQFDLAIFLLSESGLQKQQREAIGNLKNLHSSKVLVLAPHFDVEDDENYAAKLQGDNALRSMGFFLGNRYSVGGYHYDTFSYNIESYNRKRSWNNPRFWANPENFQKYRW